MWESDSLKKANYLVDVAEGTKRVSTDMPIDVKTHERPPEKVMQTDVVGTNGSLTYRLNLDGFPGYGWAATYFAEIEDLRPSESRKFRLILPGHSDMSIPIVNIQENALGKYRLYQPGYPNVSLPFVLSFRFGKTSDSSMGPLLNALEVNKYLKESDGSMGGEAIASVISLNTSADWAQEGSDPCLPVPWSWLDCTSDERPTIAKIRNMVLLFKTWFLFYRYRWLDGNNLTGPIPDFSGCANLEIIHLENNQLTGEPPSSLASPPNLRELHVQNNLLSGSIPSDLLDKNIVLK
ncbi:probable LRR receptor-like serine/threonine-protein kinase At1g67720 isoform X2 [Euphorbia lathyris]